VAWPNQYRRWIKRASYRCAQCIPPRYLERPALPAGRRTNAAVFCTQENLIEACTRTRKTACSPAMITMAPTGSIPPATPRRFAQIPSGAKNECLWNKGFTRHLARSVKW